MNLEDVYKWFNIGNADYQHNRACVSETDQPERALVAMGWRNAALRRELKLANPQLRAAIDAHGETTALENAMRAREHSKSSDSGVKAAKSASDVQTTAENTAAPQEYEIRDWVNVQGVGLGWVSGIEYDNDLNPAIYQITPSDSRLTTYRARPEELERADMPWPISDLNRRQTSYKIGTRVSVRDQSGVQAGVIAAITRAGNGEVMSYDVDFDHSQPGQMYRARPNQIFAIEPESTTEMVTASVLYTFKVGDIVTVKENDRKFPGEIVGVLLDGYILKVSGRGDLYKAKPEQVEAIPGKRNAPDATKHSHYFRACPYDHIDVYRILEIFEVKDPCAQHAIKKLLALGNRGQKDSARDVQDVIDTMTRWQKMRAEENENGV